MVNIIHFTLSIIEITLARVIQYSPQSVLDISGSHRPLLIGSNGNNGNINVISNFKGTPEGDEDGEVGDMRIMAALSGINDGKVINLQPQGNQPHDTVITFKYPCIPICYSVSLMLLVRGLSRD